jgi:hypothetical protein
MQQRWTEPLSPLQNRAKLEIQGLTCHFRRIIHRMKCPEIYWCYGIEYAAEISERMDREVINNRTPIETTPGDTVDISESTNLNFMAG